MAITSLGIGSGLDVNSIVTQLMQVESQPLDRYNQKEAEVQAEISSYGLLKGGLSKLQSTLETLQDADTYSATKASSSDESVLTVSSDTTAITSSYNITVNRLAQQHKLGSSEFSSSATFGGAAGDALTVAIGTSTFTVDLSTAKTLADIQSAINDDTNTTGVTAGLITGDNGNQTLVLTSDSTGYDNRVQLTYSGSINATTINFSMLNRDASNNLLASETELDASLTLDGVAVTRASNTIGDVVSGLTLNLKGAGQSNVGISENADVAVNAVKSFVAEYNNVKDQLSTLAESGASGSVLRGIESQLRNSLNNGLSGLGNYSYISELGVTTNPDTGKLQFDSSMMTDALSGYHDSVVSFFSDADGGFAATMDSMLEGFVGVNGTIDSLVEGANSRVDRISASRDSFQRRLDTIEARYLKQFGALDTLMASMTTTSNYLTTQLDALASLTNNSSNN